MVYGNMKAKRRRAAKAQNNRCHYCCEQFDRSVTLDHKKPRSQGGRWNRDNLVAACAPCNMAKADIPYADFMAMITAATPPASKHVARIWISRRLEIATARACLRLLTGVYGESPTHASTHGQNPPTEAVR